MAASKIEEKVGLLYKKLNMSKDPQEKEGLKKKIGTTEKDLENAEKKALPEIVKAYELFCTYFISKACTQWDKVVQEMHQKDPWVAVNGSLNPGPCKKTWASFLDCIELHKLTIFSSAAAACQEAPTCYGASLRDTHGPPQQLPGLSAHGQGQLWAEMSDIGHYIW